MIPWMSRIRREPLTLTPKQRQALAEAMTDLMKAYGVRQQGAEKLLGISQRQISQILNGETTPMLPTLVRMRELLGRPIDSILGLPPMISPEVRQFVEATFDEQLAKHFGRPQDRKALEEAKRATAPLLPEARPHKRRRKEQQNG